MKRQYSTRKAAKKLGKTIMTIQRHIKAGSFPVPPVANVHGVKVRLWSDHDIAVAKKYLSGLKPGPKKKS
jgi:hypothetical protein